MDPDGAAKRREHAEREEARVRFWRDNGGACALAAFGLPTDAALAANDAINDRAAAYKAAKLRPEARWRTGGPRRWAGRWSPRTRSSSGG